MGETGDGQVDDGVELRPLEPADTPGLRELIERCYGDAYPKRVMYEPDALAKLIRSGEHSGVVAVSGEEVVGHMAYTWPDPDATVVEAGTTVVDPEWRGRGLMNRLALALAEQLVADGAAGFIHFPTTAHPVMQKASLGAGGKETGILIAYLPPGLQEPGGDEAGDRRLAVTVVYQPVVEAPGQRIHLPIRHAELILGLAGELGLSREPVEGSGPAADETRLERALDPQRDLERVRVERIGRDIPATMSSILEDTDARLIHVDLPMNDPGIDEAGEALRPLGFGFAAWLPGWAGHDVLRLQWIDRPADADLSPDLYSPEAGALMDLIRTDLLGSD